MKRVYPNRLLQMQYEISGGAAATHGHMSRLLLSGLIRENIRWLTRRYCAVRLY